MQLLKRHSDQKKFFEGLNVVLAGVHVCHGAPHQLYEDLVVRLVELHVERLWIIVFLLLRYVIKMISRKTYLSIRII